MRRSKLLLQAEQLFPRVEKRSIPVARTVVNRACVRVATGPISYINRVAASDHSGLVDRTVGTTPRRVRFSSVVEVVVLTTGGPRLG